MIFHIDGNSFYASCEALFRPDLADKPIAVLSNNDGITIALNQECKDLGFKRGDAYFKMNHEYEAKGVTVFSSNYTLYADLCLRINMIYNSFCPDVEMYSIDESFLFFPPWKNIDWVALGHEIKNEVAKQVHLPVAVGIAPTKTLAKICNKHAKKKDGVCYWHALNKEKTLKNYAVHDVWGIGQAKTKLLSRLNIKTAYDLQKMPLYEAKRHLTIQGFKTVQELGEVCAIDRQVADRRKNICCSKSFARGVSTLVELETALTEYVQQAVERMRKEGSACKVIMVYITTARSKNACNNEYYNEAREILPHVANYLPDIVKTARKLLHTIYRPGYSYRKVMVHLLGLEDDTNMQRDLFEQDDSKKQKAIMHVCDSINTKYGSGCLHMGTRNQIQDVQANGKKANWHMQRNFLSPKYTTKLSDIPHVY
ncbi:MAG TPA: Y-family DNA polymerase [Treponemataceae bacterium]|nr:Y-family DNA polymerase [Treponemataceae bacterium]